MNQLRSEICASIVRGWTQTLSDRALPQAPSPCPSPKCSALVMHVRRKVPSPRRGEGQDEGRSCRLGHAVAQHPHPSPLPTRERGDPRHAVPTVKIRAEQYCVPLPQGEREPIAQRQWKYLRLGLMRAPCLIPCNIGCDTCALEVSVFRGASREKFLVPSRFSDREGYALWNRY